MTVSPETWAAEKKLYDAMADLEARLNRLEGGPRPVLDEQRVHIMALERDLVQLRLSMAKALALLSDDTVGPQLAAKELAATLMKGDCRG